MSEHNGWIKMYRKLREKGWINKPNYVALWVRLLLDSNHKQKEFMWNNKIMIVKAGQLITGRKELSKKTGINENSVERILKCFENEHQIEQQTTSKFRLITVINWKEYQGIEQQNEQQVNNKPTTSEQQVNTNKNIKNIKNDKKELKIQIEPYRNEYPESMLTDFLLYWEEKDSKGRQRWEQQATWEINLRLQKWKRNQEKWENKFKIDEGKDVSERRKL